MKNTKGNNKGVPAALAAAPLLSHHANLLIGGEKTRTNLLASLEKSGIALQGNSDFRDFIFQNLTIDNARELKAWASIKPATEKGLRVAVIHANAITIEAQNALLKVLEEPPTYARFYIIVPSIHLLLPTIKSRLNILDSGGSSHETVSSDAAQFLKATPAKRLELIKDLLDDISKEKRPKQDAIDFLNDIQAAAYEADAPAATMKSIETARRYMNDRAPSLKMLLEFVALNI